MAAAPSRRHRLLILGTGGMANAHAEHFAREPNIEIVAGVDRDPERLAAFLARHKVPHGFASLEEALAWGEFDAACNVTPDAVHHATTLPLLAAGKHVLCEKPLAPNAAHAAEMAAVAERAGVINMLNLTYRGSPQLQEAARLVSSGAIGALRHFEASYLQSWLTQPAWGDWKSESQWLWRLSTAHGSTGCLGDIGVHIVDFLSYAAGESVSHVSCRLVTFDKAPGGRIGDYVLDANDSFTMQARLAGGALGVIHASRFATGHHNDLRLQLNGTLGAIELQFGGEDVFLRACLGAEAMLARDWQVLTPPPSPTNYQRFAAALDSGVQPDPGFARGAELQRVLDLASASHDAAGAELAV